MILTLLIAAVAPASGSRPSIPLCASSGTAIEAPCALPMRVSPAAAQHVLQGRSSAWWVAGDKLTVISRVAADEAALCCAIQTAMMPLGEGLSAVTVRVPRIDEAIFDVIVMGSDWSAHRPVYRGPDAPPAPPVATPLSGRLIPFAFDSKALGETRRGTIYVPAAVPKAGRLPAVYLADGATSQFAPILEAAVRDGRAAPAIIVGIDSADGMVADCGKRICDRRNLDYIANQNPGETEPDPQFSRHLRFVADELVSWVEANYPASPRRQDRIVAGFSSGAAWAFATAALRPELFGNVLGMSSGSASTIRYAAALNTARVYTGAGIFEPTVLASTRERARLARAAGAEVRFREMVAGHSMSMWDILFADGITWLLPPGR